MKMPSFEETLASYLSQSETSSLKIPVLLSTPLHHSLAAMVVMERHLWLNLEDIREKEKNFLLDAPI